MASEFNVEKLLSRPYVLSGRGGKMGGNGHWNRG